ncbi:MAG: cell division protein FtsW [Anaerolineales bacterium]|nr:cell division protein FtsW [Anaerolineales bacterium]
MATVTTVRYRTESLFSRPFRRMDYGLLVATIALSTIGLIMVYSSSLFVSLTYTGTINYYFIRQLVAVLLGFTGIIALQTIDYRIFRRFSIVSMLGTLFLLFFVLIVGDTLLGAKRGLYQGSFQPSELAKLIMISYIADWLSSKGERIKDFGMGFVPFVVLVGIVGGLIAVQPDLSTAVLITIVAFTMFFIAGARWSHFFFTVLVGVLAFILLISMFEHAAQRWNDYWLMVQNPNEAVWHIKQVFYGFARGGLTGRGLGNSFQKTGPLPMPHTDSILAVIGEELGLIGCLLVLLILLYIGYRGFRIMMDTKDSYGRMLSLGISSWLVYQALINTAVMTGVVPFTGLPFPFLSYGGSSMLVSLLGVGILLNISQQNKRLEAGLDRKVMSKEPHKRGKSIASASVRRRDGRTHIPRPSRSH